MGGMGSTAGPLPGSFCTYLSRVRTWAELPGSGPGRSAEVAEKRAGRSDF